MNRAVMLTLAGAALLVGCAPVTPLEQKIAMNGQYWQRIDTTDLIYQRGPKAQQMLMRDIARCTSELNELERQGYLRGAIPREPARTNSPDPDHNGGGAPTPTEDSMNDWETPQRDGYLLTEPQEYHDFEGCMYAKGWDRTKHVPYETAVIARENYLTTMENQRARTHSGERRKATDPQRSVEERGTGGNATMGERQLNQ
ncbi:MAG: hypothetical protein V4621_07165 [Pseudomonadota bacterium]